MHNLRIPLQHYTVGRILSVHRGELALEEDDRKSLLRQVRSGEFADSLEIEAITYLQEDKPNRNFLRFKPSILSKVAKSFIGVPFLKDHEHGKLEARGGTIVASKLEKDENGVPRFRQRIQLVKPWAIEGALDGTLDRFSISWHSDKRPVCSIDGDPILSGYYSRMDGECTHFPGDEVTNDETGDVQICEAVYIDAVGIETSAVSVPAVPGTSVEEIRASLSAQIKELKEKPEMKDFFKIAKALGLPEDADLAECLGVIEKKDALFQAEKSAHKETAALLDAKDAEIASLRKNGEAAQLESMIDGAIRDGKIQGRVGDKLSDREERTRSFFTKFGLDAAKDYVEGLNRITAAGELAVSDGKDPKPAGTPLLTEEQKEMNRLCGISDETFKKYNPQFFAA